MDAIIICKPLLCKLLWGLEGAMMMNLSIANGLPGVWLGSSCSWFAFLITVYLLCYAHSLYFIKYVLNIMVLPIKLLYIHVYIINIWNTIFSYGYVFVCIEENIYQSK